MIMEYTMSERIFAFSTKYDHLSCSSLPLPSLSLSTAEAASYAWYSHSWQTMCSMPLPGKSNRDDHGEDHSREDWIPINGIWRDYQWWLTPTDIFGVPLVAVTAPLTGSSVAMGFIGQLQGGSGPLVSIPWPAASSIAVDDDSGHGTVASAPAIIRRCRARDDDGVWPPVPVTGHSMKDMSVVMVNGYAYVIQHLHTRSGTCGEVAIKQILDMKDGHECTNDEAYIMERTIDHIAANCTCTICHPPTISNDTNSSDAPPMIMPLYCKRWSGPRMELPHKSAGFATSVIDHVIYVFW